MTLVTGVATVGREQERHETATPLGVGVAIWLASELMFFAGLFAAYFALKAHNEPAWPPPDVHFELWRTRSALSLVCYAARAPALLLCSHLTQ